MAHATNEETSKRIVFPIDFVDLSSSFFLSSIFKMSSVVILVTLLNNISNARIRKLDDDHYVIYNDFGSINYNKEQFDLKELHIFGPSSHIINSIQ